MIRFVIASIVLMAVFAAPFKVFAKEAYFEALYDIPIMPGLEEMKDQAMLFDKPDGKIASVVAISKTLKPKEVDGFYNATLPPLGWEKMGPKSYIRGAEKLELRIEENPPFTILYLGISPRQPKDN
jgi:hypothetical protein